MVITSFTGRYGFLSNFYGSPVELPFWSQRITFPTAEHGFQARKAMTMEDVLKIIRAGKPGDAKRAGRALAEIRPDWEAQKRRFMLEVLLAKFSQNTELRSWLTETGDEALVEGNAWGDRYWGAVSMAPGTYPDSAAVWAPGPQDEPHYLVGENWLGRLLMITRAVLS